MRTVHIVVGDEAANSLQTAFNTIENFNDELLIIKDIFNIGPLKSETLTFSQLRTKFWQEILKVDKIAIKDLEELMNLSSRLSNSEVDKVCYWMAGIPSDTCAYYWLLHFLKKHMGRLHVININGLPFIGPEGRLFYPESISQLPEKQVIKAMKLLRVVSPSEWETEAEQWKKLISDTEHEIRILSGVKQLTGKPINHYDTCLLSLVTKNNQKIHKIVFNAIEKYKIHTGHSFLIWRLEQMQASELIIINKDNVKLFTNKNEASEANPDLSDSEIEK
ncbi:MAG TPA: DUF1835 domain-containing protein [Edaphocola sp.]|nr:DUF1835 domain-containing protein [Edaphocola sp.]